MLTRARSAVVVALVVVMSCSKKPEPSEPAREEVVAAKTKPVDGGAPEKKPPEVVIAPEVVTAPSDPYTCTTAADCVNSCSQGAVNLLWYQEKFPGGEMCKDGCTSKGTEPARCIDGGCVAFLGGRRSDACTEVTKEFTWPGPAHYCAKASDCMLSCRYGAVNKAWYERSTLEAECDAGCAGVRAEPPKCEDEYCVAYRDGKRDDSCTKKSIW